MKIEEIIDFLETDTLSFNFSTNGLKSLSLRNNYYSENIDLREFNMEEEKDSVKLLIVKETINFLETGIHNMPLDLSDLTLFQQKVLKTISEIGPGHIFTYKEVGEIIEKPGAAQAVGNATSRNPVCYFIPTHRVLPKRGIGLCKSGAGYLREKLLILEGHDILKLRGNYECKVNKCHLDR